MNWKPLIVAGAILIAGVAVGVAAVTAPMAPSGQPMIFANYQQARTISTGAVFPVTRAIYNGNASACDITIRLNMDVTPIDFKNVQPGAVLSGFMATEVTPTGCSNLVALY